MDVGPLTVPWREFPQLFLESVKRWFNDGASRFGAAIAYYTLFALAPVLLVVIAFAGLFFGDAAVRGEIVSQIAGLIGQDGAVAVQAMLERASDRKDGIIASVAGIAGMLLATTGAFLELQSALNRIWHVRPDPSKGFNVKGLLWRRLRSLSVAVSIGFLLVVSLSVSAAVAAAIRWIESFSPTWPFAIEILNQVIGLGVSTLLFAMLYRVLPDVQLQWNNVVVGAFVTAVLFAVGQQLIGLYLGHSAVASPFGAAGTLAIILVWVFYSVQVVLLGAEFTHVYSERCGRLPGLKSGTVRYTPEGTADDVIAGGASCS